MELTENQGGKTLATNQVSVTSSATLIKAASSRLRITLTNTGAAAVFIGKDNTVTTTTGHSIPAGGVQVFYTRSALYGIVASGTATVTYAEESL